MRGGTGEEAAPPVLAELVRGRHVESRHRGAIVVCAPSGEVVTRVGDPDTFVYLRSAAKPFQLLAFLASGAAARFEFSSEELAVMAASHSGEDRHVELVEGLLGRVGLDESALKCGTHPPYDSETADRLAREGLPAGSLRHNCSGKHTGMLLFAAASGWSTDDYWRADHPVQRAALECMALFSGIAVDETELATDGCGVPTFGMPLRGLATAFARLADPSLITDALLRTGMTDIRSAMSKHPELVGGENRRLDTALMRAAAGRVVAKAGAEGIQAVAIPGSEPSGLALVIEDGDAARRATGVATCEGLRQLGVLDEAALQTLSPFAAPVVHDPRGDVSARVRPAFTLA